MTKLLPCPFCGGPADFENITPESSIAFWSVGCQSVDSDCIAYQMLASFNRKCEAAEAWNKRAPIPIVPTLDKTRLDAAYQAYWDNSSGTYTSIEAAILCYINGGSELPLQSKGALEMKCIKDRCYSPVACSGFGYCRERNSTDVRIVEETPAAQPLLSKEGSKSASPNRTSDDPDRRVATLPDDIVNAVGACRTRDDVMRLMERIVAESAHPDLAVSSHQLSSTEITGE